jgi:molybdate transport system substrate-binding protein
VTRLLTASGLLWLVVGTVLTGCSPGGTGADIQGAYVTDVEAGASAGEGTAARLAIAAASDLRPLLEAIRPAIEGRCTTAITTTYGSSGQLARQIVAGAPFGLFLSADTRYVDEVVRSGRAAPASAAVYGRGRLAVITRTGLPLPSSLAELADTPYRTIGIANPDHAPYGRAGREALSRAGILERIEGRLVVAENVRQTLEYVENGSADAGVVALPLVIGRGAGGYLLVDSALHAPITQAGVVMRGTGAERTARCALQYLLSDDGQRALGSFGYEPAEG